jgi:protoporphyrinogen oxidase
MTKKVAIIGAGPMGLVCAYELSKQGYKADIFERGQEIGGMSEHFDFSGISLEKFYHSIAKCDDYLFDLLKELDLYKYLSWTETKMGFYYNGKLYKWGGPVELLQFKGASLIEKARYGFHVFYCGKLKNWKKLDNLTAVDWIKKWEGEKGYLIFWENLLRLKFDKLKDIVSAPWFWSRISKVAQSRKNIFKETLGFISGGSLTLLKTLQQKIEACGCGIYLGNTVERINFQNERVTSLIINGKQHDYDVVISTIPLQYLNKLAKLPVKEAECLENMDNIGCVCVVVKTNITVTDSYITNIADEKLGVTGIIEYSNLNSELKEKIAGGGGAIVYVPFYLHSASERYHESDEFFFEKSVECLCLMNQSISRANIKDMRVFRYEYAQPVQTINFSAKLPPMYSSERKGFYFADTAYGYPRERSINESIKIVKKLTEVVIAHEV